MHAEFMWPSPFYKTCFSPRLGGLITLIELALLLFNLNEKTFYKEN